jgi:hypothetical protein
LTTFLATDTSRTKRAFNSRNRFASSIESSPEFPSFFARFAAARSARAASSASAALARDARTSLAVSSRRPSLALSASAAFARASTNCFNNILFNSRNLAASLFVALSPSPLVAVDFTALARLSGAVAARSGLASARCSRNNALALADNGVDGVDGDETTAPLARKSRAFIVGIPLDDDRLVRPARAGVVVIFGESDPIRVSFASNSRPNARGVVVIVVIVRPRSFVRVSVVVSSSSSSRSSSRRRLANATDTFRDLDGRASASLNTEV